MSITVPVSQTVASQKRRTWRVNIETANGQTPVISGYREVISLDAMGNQVGLADQSMVPLQMALDAAAIAKLPAEYQPLPELISSFFDWLEQNPSGVAAPAAPVAPAE
jgi:hypothetical protein